MNYVFPANPAEYFRSLFQEKHEESVKNASYAESDTLMEFFLFELDFYGIEFKFDKISESVISFESADGRTFVVRAGELRLDLCSDYSLESNSYRNIVRKKFGTVEIFRNDGDDLVRDTAFVDEDTLDAAEHAIDYVVRDLLKMTKFKS